LRRSKIITLAFVLTLSLIAGVFTQVGHPASASASAKPLAASEAAHEVPLKFKPFAGGPKVVGIPLQKSAPKARCGLSQSALSKYRSEGVSKVSCLQQTPASAAVKPAAQSAAGLKADASAGNSLWCETDEDGPDEWWVTRTSVCTYQIPFTFTLFDTDTGEEIGFADMEFSDAVVTSPNSSAFTETNYITMVDEDNAPEVETTYTGLCDALCVPDNSAAEVDAPLTEGETISGNTTYSDAPPTKTFDTTDLSNSISMTVPGGTPVSPGYELDPAQVRCDNGLISDTSTTTGCVFPIVQPTVLFSLSGTGSTAAIDDWAMQNEQAAWGYEYVGSPLTRITSGDKIDANRTAICGNFVPLYTNDSCEEYPFASTTQSGGNNNYTGADCAQVEAVNDNGTWDIEELSTVNNTEPCVVGHADTTSQNSQGGTLSTFYQQNRVIAGDNFWVGITS
jgi:hypothetical protein